MSDSEPRYQLLVPLGKLRAAMRTGGAVGVSALLKARHRDDGEALHYYVATVHIEESDDALLSAISWFTNTVPEVQRLWREGKLVPGTILDR